MQSIGTTKFSSVQFNYTHSLTHLLNLQGKPLPPTQTLSHSLFVAAVSSFALFETLSFKIIPVTQFSFLFCTKRNECFCYGVCVSVCMCTMYICDSVRMPVLCVRTYLYSLVGWFVGLFQFLDIPLKRLCMCLSLQKLINYLDNLYVYADSDHSTNILPLPLFLCHSVTLSFCVFFSLFFFVFHPSYVENEYIGENVVKTKLHFIRSSGTL